MQKQKFVQIGVTAARDPKTGEFLTATPIYAEVTPKVEVAAETTVRDIGKILAEKMKKYIDGGGCIKS